METISVSDFKKNVFGLFDEISKSGDKLVVTKRGKPVVMVLPYKNVDLKPIPDKLAGTITFEDDIVSSMENEE